MVKLNMTEIFILGPNKNYKRVSINKEKINQALLEMRGNLNSEQLLDKLSTKNTLSARGCQLYGASIPFNLAGRIGNLPADIADFFYQIDEYRSNHQAEYVLVQSFNFSVGRAKNELSAIVQLLI